MKKNTLLLIAGTALLFTACSKDSSDPVPTPTPVVGEGTGKFIFSVDTAIGTVDTLIVSYLSRDGQTKTETILGKNSWNSPDLTYKTGDSIHADVQAIGTVKVGISDFTTNFDFKANPSTAPVPTPKRMKTNSGTLEIKGKRFKSTRFTYNVY